MKIAILGWGSLIWDERPKFDKWREGWLRDGPALNIEFSRISGTRSDALTLVVDDENGEKCTVQYAMSRRQNHEDTIRDLQNREGTTPRMIGYFFPDDGPSGQPKVPEQIKTWTMEYGFDVVIWTGLTSNFHEKKKFPFSVPEALSHLQSLTPAGKADAAEYVWRAPDFIDTPLRRALETEPWFTNISSSFQK